jgi:hypothetical protein
MLKDQLIIISREDLPELAKLIAPLIRESITKSDTDPYLTPMQLVNQVPALSLTLIKTQIRNSHYGKKIGPKGKLVAKVSEVKKFNRV